MMYIVNQCLLVLANLYALSAPTLDLKRRNFDSSLQDRIGLCYLQRAASSSSNEVYFDAVFFFFSDVWPFTITIVMCNLIQFQ